MAFKSLFSRSKSRGLEQTVVGKRSTRERRNIFIIYIAEVVVTWWYEKQTDFFSGFISNFNFSINNAFFIACIWSKPFPSAHPSYATVDIFILFIALNKSSRLLKEGSEWKWILTLFLCSTIPTDYLSVWKSSWLRIIFRDYTLPPLNIFVNLLCLLHLKHCEEIWLSPCIQLAFSFSLKNYILELEIQ